MQNNDKWQNMQDDIAAFTDYVFGGSNPVSKLHHLKEEVEELIENPTDNHEWADCMILLIDAAKKAGHDMDDLYRFVEEKMKINKNRKWGEPDENGVVRHIS